LFFFVQINGLAFNEFGVSCEIHGSSFIDGDAEIDQDLSERNKQKAQVLTLHHKEWLRYIVLILDVIDVSIGEQGHCYVVQMLWLLSHL